MSIVSLKIDYDRLKAEHDQLLKSILEAYSEDAQDAFLADPKSVWFQYGNETRQQGLLNQWDHDVRRAQDRLERKAERLALVHAAYMRECSFQEEHAYVKAMVDDKVLCGYYKVGRICSNEGWPMHYEFILKRSTHVLGNEIPSKVIVPLSTMMGVGEWQDVTLSKITLVE
jgi:hypothetical protein